MHPILRLAVAAIAVVAVGFAGLKVLTLATGTGVAAVSSPRPSPSSPIATSPASSPNPLDTATWTSYVSTRYGFSIGHPVNWSEVPSDRVWTLADAPDWLTTATEHFKAPGADINVSAWSTPVKSGTSTLAWILDYCAKNDQPSCDRLGVRTSPVTVDGHAGSLVQFPDDTQAFILVGNRMYVVAVWEPDNDPRTAPYGGAVRLLSAYLSTMRLLPGGADSAASASPS